MAGRKRKRILPADDPLWYKDAIIYQLHVKSFFDSNGDGIGDFKGLISKLDYLADLGVTALWLLPFYPSPRRDDGYDIAEYRGVHPDYGSMGDARRFIAEAHERGMRVITELVINHTSDQHPWFKRARAAPPGSSFRKFYVWSDSDQAYDGTRIIFLDTEKSNWTWDPEARAYFWHRFYSHQPDLNFDHPPVLKEVLNIMRFWLDAGVDGLRLDAVPYLVEREGTSNENLPETHAVLKKIRASLDAAYPGRMLLAEANQWPEDVQEYFGDGDECHMAFHFPLMPRMYMATAQEDRFPVTDIMRQTPSIPDNCQWAIFLRNHDELTLEMVTDSERDYLWDTYASDRRARLNLGIRRRLAPLLERDRRRIELLNSLLFSMPGTPIIYYGDEIGMGDNLHLGDRDGVRPPMQWSPDRNAGFSRADPEQLVLPPVMDPLYGFDAVNVESQQRDSHSLLNWTRRMLGVRRRHKAFGRGDLRFLFPGNRKILAYLREYEGETLLCVANLSRASQAVELELSEFAGRVPVELLGGTAFPPIGQLTYLLTLPPYGFYWFQLASEAAHPAWHTPAPEPMPDYTTLVLRQGLRDVVAGAVRQQLEGEILPVYLPKRRWFAAKDQKLSGVTMAASTMLRTPDGDLLLTEVETKTGAGSSRYFIPLGIAWGDANLGDLRQQLALARVRQVRRVGLLTDGFSLDQLPRSILDNLRRNSSLEGSDGTVEFRSTSRFAEVEIPDDADIRRLSAEQSNSSVIVGDIAVVKLIRRITPGIHPEAEMSRHLTDCGFANTPALFGEMVRTGTDGESWTLGLVQAFVRNQGDGWGWTLDYLKRTVDELAHRAAPDEEVDEALASYHAFSEAVGRRLGELHAVLSRQAEDPAFAPEVADETDVGAWTTAVSEQLERALAIAAKPREWPDEATAADAEALLAQRESLLNRVQSLAEEGRGALKTRTHGDFHLGQVLVVQGDAFLIDFEGEPSRSLAERRSKTCPLRDVAGFIRSLDYAAAAALGEAPAEEFADAHERRAEVLRRFRADAETAFFRGYRDAADSGEVQWVAPEAMAALIDLFLLEKAAYEVAYEAANRPRWIGLPIRGLLALGRRLSGDEKESSDAD